MTPASRPFLRSIRSPRPYLLLLGFAIVLAAWHLVTAVLDVPMFRKITPPAVVLKEWFNPEPFFGVSVFTSLYYSHIAYSVYRAYTAFALAVLFGVPLGILIGWNRTFRELTFPLVETLRPIPPLSWVPLAILMLPGTEPPVIFVTFIAAFFATVLNTVLGVRSIDPSYFRAAECLGFARRDILVHVVIPGAMPHVFIGLQIAMGLSWVALVAGEMIAGKRGLGYMIYDAYSMVQIPTIFMGMLTLGLLGFFSSALVRYLGRRLMAWRSF
ncbi:MAG TPA: ABC transporter permease [Burkholderiales bacterium]|nr:ABC transporter permease [Burkholderiales bacterium]